MKTGIKELVVTGSVSLCCWVASYRMEQLATWLHVTDGQHIVLFHVLVTAVLQRSYCDHFVKGKDDHLPPCHLHLMLEVNKHACQPKLLNSLRDSSFSWKALTELQSLLPTVRHAEKAERYPRVYPSKSLMAHTAAVRFGLRRSNEVIRQRCACLLVSPVSEECRLVAQQQGWGNTLEMRGCSQSLAKV